MEGVTDSLLPEAMMLLQSVVLSCVDKKQFPFSKTQLNIFSALELEEEMTMKQAARYLACSQEQTTRAVAPLVNLGFVERRIDASNRTRVFIRLTAEGKSYLKGQRAAFKKNLEDKLHSALTKEENEALCRAACDLKEILEKVKKSEV